MIQQRCVNHELREAASRCPVCLRYFCRECVTEHEDRVLCAECLKKVIASENVPSGVGRSLVRGLLPIAGLLMAWLFFYAIGRTLLLIPSAVHDGTIWESR
jgi:hypothetical protein